MISKKLFFTLFIFVVLFIVSSCQIKAQSAVYFCTETGAFGFAYGYSTVREAKDAAYDACKDYGGTNPSLVTSTSNKGYGAIAIGTDANDSRIIGAALGYKYLSDAKSEAIRICKEYGGEDVEIKNTFNDE
ncbi:MAG: DUF4189 domain-containing protein [Bacteroidota bacterium]|nr:DUF4189 domain-containing protein [Bacteroidota bacterium]